MGFSSLQERDAFFLKGPDVPVGPGSYDPYDAKSTKEIDPKTIYVSKERRRSQK